jgi:hypothetical protein
MDIRYVATTESYIDTFTWTSGNSTPAGTILWNGIVDPGQYVIYGASGLDIPKINMTASCFAATPFQYWRGSIIYRFQIVCSALHKGRLRIVYDPEIEVSANDPTRTTPEYNLAYHTVVDISETQDFEVVVGWGQPSSYRENCFYAGIGPMFDNTPLLYNSSLNNAGNGVLGVYVMNELVNPSASVDDCYVVVSMRAGPDFEVACPTGRPMARLRYLTHNLVSPPEPLVAPIEEIIEPQSAELPVSAVPSGEANMAEGAAMSSTMADLGSLTSHTNDVFMGETVRSFRTLLKRFTMLEIVTMDNLVATYPATAAIALQRASFPFEPGYTRKSNLDPNRIPKTVQGKEYAYGFLTPLRFISSGYVGWRGSIRWKVAMGNTCCNMFKSPVSVTRYTGCTPANISETVPYKTTNAGLAAWYTGFDELSTLQEGGQVVTPTTEPIVSFEAPFYSMRRFLSARSLAAFQAELTTAFNPCWKLGFEMLPEQRDVSFQLYCAAGEDFNLGMFVGAPVVYLEGIPPQ